MTIDRETVEPAGLGQSRVAYLSIPAFDSGRRPANETAVNIKSLKLLVRAPRVLISKLNPEISRVWPILENDKRPMLASTEFINFGPKSDRTTPPAASGECAIIDYVADPAATGDARV